MINLTTREAVMRRLSALKTERATWMEQWREINTSLLPRTGRFFATEENKGHRRDDILDDTATAALTTLGAGMQYGQTSPARPWVRIETADPDLMESAEVSLWCDKVTRLILMVFARSNTYNTLHSMYEELGAYGVAASIVLPDYENIIQHTPLTIGEYTLATNSKNQVDTLGRELQMTVAQIVEKYVAGGPPLREKSGSWDWSIVSPTVKNLFDNHQMDSWVRVQQLIEPRRYRNPSKRDPKNMAWRNVVIEEGVNSDKVMHEGGFLRFPVVAPRWQVSGNDVYGSSCPGMRALGGMKQLQFEHMRKAQAIDFQVNPPLLLPSSLRNQESDFLPGGLTYYDPQGTNTGKVESAFNVQLNLQHLLLDVNDQRQMINTAFYADIFLMMDRLQGIQPRNQREVEERHEEKLLMLGPVVERQQNELLGPLIDITFDALSQAGALPPIPEQLQGHDLDFKYTSVLAQAQRRASMAGVDRIVGAVASIAAAKQDPSVWDKVDTDVIIDKAAGYEGVDAEMIRGKEDVQKLREARAQAQQAQQQAADRQQAAETAKTLAAAPMNTDTALTNVVRGFANQ